MNDGEYEEILEDMKEEGQKFGMYIQHFFFPQLFCCVPLILLATQMTSMSRPVKLLFMEMF